MRIPEFVRSALIWRCFDIATSRDPDFVIGDAGRPYMNRWWLIPRNRAFNIYLHQVVRDDDDRALHDHPWASCSIILQGGYIEELPVDGTTRSAQTRETVRHERKPGQVTFRRASAPHRLITHKDRQPSGHTIPRPSWSLFLTGPRVREWGFWCSWGWRPWKEFVSPKDSGSIGRGCD